MKTGKYPCPGRDLGDKETHVKAPEVRTTMHVPHMCKHAIVHLNGAMQERGDVYIG